MGSQFVLYSFQDFIIFVFNRNSSLNKKGMAQLMYYDSIRLPISQEKLIAK